MTVRVLFVDHTPFAGGAQLVLAKHIEHLDRDRFSPLVACTGRVPALVERYREAGAKVHILSLERLKERDPRVLLRLFRSAWQLRRLIRRERVDLVVSNTSRAAYVSSLAVLGTGVPLVWWVRDFLFGRCAFAAFRRAPTAVIGVSRAIRSHYRGDGDDHFHVVYVGSDLYEQTALVTEVEIEQERARWGIGRDEVVVGFMGRLVEEKGPQDLLAAVERLHAEFPRLRLLFVGTGKGQEGDIEPMLRHEAAIRGLTFVAFSGYQTNEALYYRLFDIFVLSTRTVDAYATSVVQAMMARIPVVATDAGGTRELVHDRVTGLLVPPGQPDAIADAIAELMKDPALAASLASAGRASVMENNREEVIAAQAEAIYEAVLEGGRG